jgi:hypothetical protein
MKEADTAHIDGQRRGGLSAARVLRAAAVLVFVTGAPPGRAAETPVGSKGVSPWPDQYQSIQSPEAERLVLRGLELGRQWIGKPRLKPRRVELRLSKPRRPESRIRQGFALTELSDPKARVFTIYLGVPPGHLTFQGQLGHEVFHVFQPYLRDVYVEGLNTYLAEKLLRTEGLPWQPWQKHFEASGDPLYGASFGLMKELAKIVGEESLFRLLLFRVKGAALPKEKGGPRTLKVEHIDIDRWLASFEAAPRDKARRIIAARYLDLEALRLKTHSTYGFRRPGAPGNGR